MVQPLITDSPVVRDVLLSVWWFAVGGCVGSFLNVVAYRTPRGMSLAAPGSHCPQCKHPIRWYDNIPILGWLHLRGRCRDCRVWISPRYPLVEAIAACVFLLVGRLMCVGYGWHLPDRVTACGSIALGNLVFASHAWGLAGFHLLLLSTLLAVALIEFDGQRVPWRVGGLALIVGAIAPLVWPFLLPVAAMSGLERWTAPLVDVAAGSALGAAFALALRRLVPAPGRSAVSLGSILVGMYLGWQAVAVLGALAAAVGLVRFALRRHAQTPQVGLAGWLGLFTLLWIVAWRAMVECCPWLG